MENDLDEYFTFEVDEWYLWKNFEANLARFNNKGFFNNYNHLDFADDSFKPSDCLGLEDEIRQEAEQLIETILEEFGDWISSVPYPNPSDRVDKLITINGDAKFINFNYTDTLELLNTVSKRDILYLHNNANSHFGDLVFGHGESMEDDPALDERDANGDSNRMMFTDAENAARAPFYDFQKTRRKSLLSISNFSIALPMPTIFTSWAIHWEKQTARTFRRLSNEIPMRSGISAITSRRKRPVMNSSPLLQIHKSKINIMLLKDLRSL